MSEVSRTIRRHHASLRRTLRAHLKAVVERPSPRRERAFVDFLHDELLPHAEAEEKAFYPAMDTVLRQHGRPTGSMVLDHERVLRYVRRLHRAARKTSRTRGPSRRGSKADFGRLCLELGALLELHLDKEEQDYLPLFDAHLSEREQEEVLRRMHESQGAEPSAETDR